MAGSFGGGGSTVGCRRRAVIGGHHAVGCGKAAIAGNPQRASGLPPFRAVPRRAETRLAIRQGS